MGKIVLPYPENITISAAAANKLIAAGDGTAALLYIYILKNRGNIELSAASSDLNIPLCDIESSISLLGRLGLIGLENESEIQRLAPADEIPQYTAEDVKREIEQSSQFYDLVQEVQRKLGKILSSDDLLRLFGIYDSLKLPPEVILLLINYCIEENRRKYGPSRLPTMRYIEKVAYTWEREELFTVESAENYLKRIEKRREKSEEIKRVLQINGRNLSPSERKYVESWIEMGFEPDVIEIAYDRTILKTGKMAWSYMNSILKNWYDKKLMTSGDILKGDTKAKSTAAKPATQSANAPTSDDIERMKKLLDKIKKG